ncbi:Thioredoxin-3, mitochondrial [Hanseniaspora uvarum DSM 2768]|nr:Thioredoxin-3, mitochondrial [Hanseniaspora uvarum DSM 2768]GMM40546.1 thioredoxin [Hanseniaspora uvarum]
MFNIRKGIQTVTKLNNKSLLQTNYISKMAVTSINTPAEFQSQVLTAQDGKVKIVDFYATWCGPCKAIAPMIEKWSTNQYADANVDFFKVDVDVVGDVAREQEVSAMPTFILFKDGQRVDQIIGADLRGLKTKLDAQL